MDICIYTFLKRNLEWPPTSGTQEILLYPAFTSYETSHFRQISFHDSSNVSLFTSRSPSVDSNNVKVNAEIFLNTGRHRKFQTDGGSRFLSGWYIPVEKGQQQALPVGT